MALLYNPVTGEEIQETRSMADIRAKTQASIAGGTTPDYEAYVKSDPNLKAYVAEHGLGTSANLADWGKWHWGGQGKQEHMTGGRASSPYRTYSQEAPAPAPAPGPGPAPETNPIVVDDPSVQTTDMASLTDEMRLSKKIQEIINTNNPLFKAATTKAMQAMAKRGLVNSSLAQGEVMNSIMAVALPIAQTEVKALTDNLYYNKDWTNKQKLQANEAAYNKMLTQIQGKINYTLQQFIEGSKFGLQQLIGRQQTGLQQLIGGQQMSMEDKVQKGRMALQKLSGEQTMALQTLLGEQNITLENLMQNGKMALQHLSGQQKMDLQDKLGQQGIDLQKLIGEQQLTIEQQRISAQAWAKYGDWITEMATAEGADQDAWKNMLELLKGAQGWPSLFG